ncbi:MAG: hypothetical protein JSV36_01120, partial [Anaerolineae bacterium]
MNKKLYLIVSAVLMATVILSACATPEPTAEPKPAAATATPKPEEPTATPVPEPAGPYENVDPTGIEVLWWHQHTQEREEGLQQMVEEFNNSNEWGIKVTAEFAGGYSEIYDKMISAIAADDPTLLPNLTVGYANQ